MKRRRQRINLQYQEFKEEKEIFKGDGLNESYLKIRVIIPSKIGIIFDEHMDISYKLLIINKKIGIGLDESTHIPQVERMGWHNLYESGEESGSRT